MTASSTGWPGSTDPDGAPPPSGSVVAGPAVPGADDLGADLDTPRTADLADPGAAAALAAPGVVSLHGGSLGEVATLLPGRRVAGVRLGGPGAGTQVQVVASTSATLTRTAEAVRFAVISVVDGPVHVVIGDVATPAERAVPGCADA